MQKLEKSFFILSMDLSYACVFDTHQSNHPSIQSSKGGQCND